MDWRLDRDPSGAKRRSGDRHSFLQHKGTISQVQCQGKIYSAVNFETCHSAHTCLLPSLSLDGRLNADLRMHGT
ncbi:hypothetical protein WJX77_011202 [Trebouxia sp. C0004]